MLRLKILFALAMILCIIGAAAIAGEQNEKPAAEMTAGEMPVMGAPEEMKKLAGMVGTWDVEQKWKMDPAAGDWESSQGTAVYMDVYNGCAMHIGFESEMMGMPYKGSGLIAFNRETGKWQMIWLDNMSALISYMQGDYKDGKLEVSGEETYQGSKYISRITTFNLTDGSFEWKYEMSMDGGKSFVTMGTAMYTKQH